MATSIDLSYLLDPQTEKYSTKIKNVTISNSTQNPRDIK